MFIAMIFFTKSKYMVLFIIFISYILKIFTSANI